MELISKKCVACSSDTPPIARTEAEKLLTQIPEWNLTEEAGILRIKKDFKFKDFKEALAFVNKVGEIAESEGHHPNIRLHNWNKVELENYTHKIKGMSENDFILAAKVNVLIK